VEFAMSLLQKDQYTIPTGESAERYTDSIGC
jgi:hypothetical protein